MKTFKSPLVRGYRRSNLTLTISEYEHQLMEKQKQLIINSSWSEYTDRELHKWRGSFYTILGTHSGGVKSGAEINIERLLTWAKEESRSMRGSIVENLKNLLNSIRGRLLSNPPENRSKILNSIVKEILC